MTRFTVLWPESVEQQLAQFRLDADDRTAVSAAANAIDQELRRDPGTKGEEIAEGLRALTEPPLRVLFAVREADRIVEVVRVRRV